MRSSNIFFIAFFAFTYLLNMITYAQVPQMFNYQGIARDAKGNPMGNRKLSLKLSILSVSDAALPEYEEVQYVVTNEFGLYTLQIGNGDPLAGQMKAVTWETGNKYIRVAIDPAGGNNFADAGTTQLLSVPYAIYADKAGVATNTDHDKTRTGTVSSNAAHVAGDANYITKFTALNTIGKSVIYETGSGNVGIGTITPAAKFQITNTVAAVQEHIRMQNLGNTGAGRFTMYNDGISSYATFTKYGSVYAGGYPGVATQYPYANLLAFGNNSITAGDGSGRFLISTAGNAGISLFKSGSSKLKFHADFSTENVGIGGSSAPVSRVHLNNTDGTAMDVRLTNNTTGHTATDGAIIRNVGNATEIMNLENSSLSIGTNNASVINLTNTGNAEFAGQIKIAGGAPGNGKVLTSNANGLASWQNPAVNGGANVGDMQYWNGTQWINIPIGIPGQTLQVNANGVPSWGGNAFASLYTNPATNITDSTAIAGGTVTAENGSPVVDRGVCYSLSNNPTLQNAYIITMGTGPGGFSDTLTGLLPNTKYYFRAYAVNSSGTGYGNLDSLTTSIAQSLPTFLSFNMQWAYDDTALFTSVLINNGFPITARGMLIGINPNPTIANNVFAISSNPDYNFQPHYFGNLTPMTTYYARAYATNANGTSYSNSVQFTTYQIGAAFGGGYIVRLDSTNKQHGVICAASDINSAPWGCQGQNITGLGNNGAVNTQIIMNGCAELSTAARFCHNLNLNGYTDWHLPSYGELYAVFTVPNLMNIVGGFNTNVGSNYWTSSLNAFILDQAGSISFLNGNPNNAVWGQTPKSNYAHVRPFRHF